MSYTRYIHNVSGGEKTYRGVPIADNAYYLIEGANLTWYQTSDDIMADLASDEIRMSADGASDYSTSPAANISFLLGSAPYPTDTDGAQLTRTKMTKTGWHYQCNAVQWETSKLSSNYNKDKAGSDLGFSAIKFYDDEDTELTVQGDLDTDCVKTVITFEATHDIEIIGGILYQSEQPATAVRIWVTAVPDLTVEQGGSVPFCQGGINLAMMGTGQIYSVDGRTPKHMPYNATYHTNKFEITCLHGAGVQHEIMMVFQLFRENA